MRPTSARLSRCPDFSLAASRRPPRPPAPAPQIRADAPSAGNRLAIDASCNWDSQSRVVAFPGPRMHEYLQFYRTRVCTWGDACVLGLRKSVCPVSRHWQAHLNATQDNLGVAMLYTCETLYAPHLYWPKFQPTP